MCIIQVFIAFVVVIVGDHFVGWTFKAHTFVASAACHSKTAVCSHDGHLAVRIWTNSHVILFHVLLEQCVTSFFGFFAGKTIMQSLFTFSTICTCTQIALETVNLEHVDLFATSSVAKTHELIIFLNILSYSHVNKLCP